MMSEAIIVSIIVGGLSLIGTIVGSWFGVKAANKLTNYRIECLEKKMDKHNCLIERMAIAENDIKVANHRIEDLEKQSA